MLLTSRRRSLGVVLLAAAFVLPACGGGADAPAFAITAAALPGDPPALPSGASVAGSETLTVYGRGFEDGATVLFGTTPAVTVTYIGPTEVQVVTPAMPEGSVDLVVVDPAGDEVRVADGFYFGTPPAIVAVNAADGPALGTPQAPIVATTVVEVTGSDFRDGAVVLLDGTPQPTTFLDADTIRFTVTAPPWEANAAVTVRNPEGIAETVADALFFTAEFNLAPQPGALDDRQLRHLLRRAGFDAPESLLAARRGLNLDSTRRPTGCSACGATPRCSRWKRTRTRSTATSRRPTRSTAARTRSGGSTSSATARTRSRSASPGSCTTTSPRARPRSATTSAGGCTSRSSSSAASACPSRTAA